MPKYVVHLHPVTDGTGKDMPTTFEIEAANFFIEDGTAVFRTGQLVAAFPAHSYRAVIKEDEKPDSLSVAAAKARENLVTS